jgi:hypothetical protein
MHLILFLPAASMFLLGIADPDSEKRTPQATGQKMWADQSTVYKDESLTLLFSTPHDSRLGVIDPDGNFFYVVYPTDAASGALQPLMDSRKFEWINCLKITTKYFKADPYTYGVYENRAVFTKSGTYRFILGDNLHTDDETLVTFLNIEYRHETRPALTRPIVRA